MNSKTLAAAAAALVLAGCGDVTRTAAPSASARDIMQSNASEQGVSHSANTGFILFTTDRDNPSPLGICPACEEIYSMLPDGTEPVRLTSNNSNDGGQAWSLEAKTIALHTNRNGYAQIFLMNVDGSDQRFLTDAGENAAGARMPAVFPDWSPTGEQLCFSSQGRPREIFVIGADGSGLTNVSNNAADDLRCDWSDANNRIAFGSTRDGNEEVYVMNADGSEPMRLTSAIGPDANPAWSPDGERIAFESNRDGNAEVYVMNADGTDQVRLTNFPGQDTKPTWSPKGDRIAFHRRILGHLEVFSMNPDGTDVVQLTTTAPPGFSGFPSWAKGKRDH